MPKSFASQTLHNITSSSSGLTSVIILILPISLIVILLSLRLLILGPWPPLWLWCCRLLVTCLWLLLRSILLSWLLLLTVGGSGIRWFLTILILRIQMRGGVYEGFPVSSVLFFPMTDSPHPSSMSPLSHW